MGLQSGALMLEAMLLHTCGHPVLLAPADGCSPLLVLCPEQCDALVILPGIPVTLGQHMEGLLRPHQDILWEAGLLSYQPWNLLKHRGLLGHAPHVDIWLGCLGTNRVRGVCAEPAHPCAGCSSVRSRVV